MQATATRGPGPGDVEPVANENRDRAITGIITVVPFVGLGIGQRRRGKLCLRRIVVQVHMRTADDPPVQFAVLDLVLPEGEELGVQGESEDDGEDGKDGEVPRHQATIDCQTFDRSMTTLALHRKALSVLSAFSVPIYAPSGSHRPG
jgi:hypothetical protein